ncbi:type I secretion C-terminal target domain-containing protein [Bradyrhizobium tropiciagri]|uniref:calcium-binding protein n=1 Tax=Bradyrhizobium tropiciagri TaxID=312253 RepID=UPI001BA7A932|nr:calcium-binding protein [Bradyrhizobium tropiciagri]MBR0869584.1 type I secretion C-terminal target domain-containing protein [Bradyrhizobium tropiciagri]
MYIEGTDGPDNLNGTDSDDQVVGKKGDDYLFGFGGNDLFTFYGGHGTTSPGGPIDGGMGVGDGADVVDGGAGNDTFQVNADYLATLNGRNSDTYVMAYELHAGSDGSALFTRSQGWDNYGAPVISGTEYSTVTLKSVENFNFIATRAEAPQSFYPISYFTVDLVTIGDLSSTGLTGQVYVDTGSGNDVVDAHAATTPILVLGGTGNDTLTGGSGTNTLYGQDGNDTLTAGSGSNTLVGGIGNDIYYSNNTSNTLVEQPNEGYDTLYTSATYVLLAANIEKLVFTGTADFIGMGNAGDNWIQGGIGNDYLIGFGGNDILYGAGGLGNALQGGTGDDTYIVENPGDTLIEFANEGHDTVLTTLTQMTLRDNIEDLRYSGSGNFNGTGNDLDNFIQGNVGNDHLVGLGGNDRLDDGGDGTNLLEGGTGDDVYIVKSSATTIIEQPNEGHDTVQTTLDVFLLPANVEDLDIQRGYGSFTGNDLANVIRVLGTGSTVYAAGGNDTVIGGAGNDILAGGAGNDTLTGGLGGDELAGGTGADRFVFTTANDGQDLIHDFSHAEGDKIDVSQLLAGLGPIGADPFTNGVLTFQPIAAFGSTGVPATRVMFDADGSAGAAAPTSLFIAAGSTTMFDHSDFILV